MRNDLLNILSNSNKDIDNQQLMDYLAGKLSGGEKHAVEQWMAENDFANDAVEGLQDFGDKHSLEHTVAQLNSELKKSLQKKRQRRKNRRLKEGPWIYFAVILVLLLCIIGWLVIRQSIR